jgi:hypothetical protein
MLSSSAAVLHREAAPSQARPPWPDTAVSNAFFRALAHWAARHVGGADTIAIPTGTVGADELTRVLRAIGLFGEPVQ